MLADDVHASAIQVTVKAAEVTADLIKAIIRHIAERSKNPRFKQGYQSLKELNKQNKKLTGVGVSGPDLIKLKNELKEYGVDFAIVKGNTSDTWTIYFKGKDGEQILNAMRKYAGISYKPERNEPQEPTTERDQPEHEEPQNHKSDAAVDQSKAQQKIDMPAETAKPQPETFKNQRAPAKLSIKMRINEALKKADAFKQNLQKTMDKVLPGKVR